MSFVWIGLGLALAYGGAETFIRGAVSLARRFRIPPIVVGLTVIAWGTSSPELAVSMKAAFGEISGVSVGNVLGSNIFNVGIILGLSALIRPVTVKLQIIRFDIPILVGISILAFALLHDAQLSRVEGGTLLAAFLTYTVITFRLAKREAPPEVVAEFEDAQSPELRSVLLECICIVVGLGLLIFGADLLVVHAVALARQLGVSETVIGLTVVAAGTSLPELVTSLIAAARREPDVAVGTIVGSNIFNVACILGLASTITPVTGIEVGSVDLIALLLSAVILVPMVRTGFLLNRWEGSVLISAYIGYVILLWP